MEVAAQAALHVAHVRPATVNAWIAQPHPGGSYQSAGPPAARLPPPWVRNAHRVGTNNRLILPATSGRAAGFRWTAHYGRHAVAGGCDGR
jgi:hypothetical protein